MEFKIKDKKLVIMAVAAVILFSWGLNHMDGVFALARRILGILSPFLLGGAIAFVLNVPLKGIEKHLGKLIRHKGLLRIIAIVLSYLLALGVISFVIATVIPEMINTLRQLSTGESKFFQNIGEWVMGLSATYPEITDYITSLQLDWAQLVNKALTMLQNSVTNVLTSTWGVATTVIGGVTTTAIGLVFSVYILALKERLALQIKKLGYAYMPQSLVKRVLRVLRISSQTFSGFISGQCTEAVVFGLLCYIGMLIFRFPYALSISVLVGFMTLIPVVGAFVGTALGGLLILVSDPLQALWFVIMVIILQQLDNNLIYPRIVGNSVGLPGMWVMVAVTLGGSIMGMLGMLVFVPLSAVVYVLVRESVYLRLRKKNLQNEDIV